MVALGERKGYGALCEVPLLLSAECSGCRSKSLDGVDLSAAARTGAAIWTTLVLCTAAMNACLCLKNKRRGLITLIVPDADRKTLNELSAKVRELAQKAKENTFSERNS
ncbi:hypothetical protein NDN08_005744 [Rhodosorus marinus]|uniref:Uncharacterized protein n=1 Tax=Rhodosorus marinus TaxID=101924 RepID=A0AAV8V497_9RHOD|nr:hypothetical protein NDN08_005744 [Rhodosorus marinus]